MAAAPLAGIPGPTYEAAVSRFAPPAAQTQSAGADVAIPAGTRTQTVAGLFNASALSPGRNYLVVAIGNLVLSLGATPPTALVLDFSNLGTFTVPTQLLVANANLSLGFALFGAFLGAFNGALTVNCAIFATATGQAVTLRAGSTVTYLAVPVEPA